MKPFLYGDKFFAGHLTEDFSFIKRGILHLYFRVFNQILLKYRFNNNVNEFLIKSIPEYYETIIFKTTVPVGFLFSFLFVEHFSPGFILLCGNKSFQPNISG